MKNQLQEIFRKFSSKDWQKFLLFLPQQSRSPILTRLSNYLAQLPPHSEYDKKIIFSLLYKNKPYNDNTYRQILHRMQGIVDNYLIYTSTLHQPKDYILLAQNPDRRRNIKRKIIADLPAQKDSILNFRTHLFIELEKQNDIGRIQNRTKEPNYQEVNNAFDRLFLIEKLKLTCGALSYATLNKHRYDFSMIESLEPFCNKQINESDGILYALYKTYLIHKYNLEEDFLNLLAFFTKNKLSRSEETDLVYKMASNFAIRQINQGRSIYFQYLFSVYQASIESDCLKNENGYIEFNTLLNILTTAFRVQKIEWAKVFLDAQVSFLLPENAETESNYLYARLAFEQQNYSQALRLLSISEPTDFFSNLLYRVLQIKCLYESDETDLVTSSLENYRIYLLRHKSNSYHFKLQSNFIKYLKKINASKGKSQNEKILTALKEEKFIAEKQWLIGQIKT